MKQFGSMNVKGQVERYVLPCLIIINLSLIFSTVFIYAKFHFSPTVFPRFFYFLKISTFLNLTTLLLSLYIKKKILLSLSDLFVLAFSVYGVIHFILYKSHAYDRLATLLLLGNLYFILRLYVVAWPYTKTVIYLFLILTGIIESIIGYLQLYGVIRSFHALQPLTGSFYNPGPLSCYLGFILCVAGGYLIKYHKCHINIKAADYLKQTTFYATLFFIMVCLPLIPVSMSRSAWIAIVFTFLVIVINEKKGILLKYKYTLSNKVIYVVVISGLLLLACGCYGVYHVKKKSADARLYIWQNSLEIVKINPAWGTGIGSFDKLYAEIQAKNLAEQEVNPAKITQADYPLCPFNEYLYVLIELGIVGLFLCLGCLLIVFKGLSRHSSVFQYGLLSILIFACTSYPFRILPIQLLIVITMALNGQRTKLPWSITANFYRVIFLCGLLSIFCSLPYFNAKKAAFLQWTQLQRYYKSDRFNESVDAYRELFPVLKDDIQYLFEYGRSLHMVGEYERSNEILNLIAQYIHDPMAYNIIGNNYKKLGDRDAALAKYELGYYYMPNRIYPLYLIAQLYREVGDTAMFMRAAQRVIEFMPKVESTATRELKQEIKAYYVEFADE